LAVGSGVFPSSLVGFGRQWVWWYSGFMAFWGGVVGFIGCISLPGALKDSAALTGLNPTAIKLLGRCPSQVNITPSEFGRHLAIWGLCLRFFCISGAACLWLLVAIACAPILRALFFLIKKCPKNQGSVPFPLLVQYGGKGQAGAAQGKQECRAAQNSLWWLSLCAVCGGFRVVSVGFQRGF